MQHLTPVGLNKDGSKLVLISNTGEEFAVPVDHRFRTALKGDNARPGQQEVKMESALRPRDIQSRIRGGESAEDVAAAAQTTLEAIMPFAAPVIAERAHVAQLAQKASIRRATAETTPSGRTLEESSLQYLGSVSVRVDDVSWDAWRRDDGRWALAATYAVRGTEYRAEFIYDQPGRYVVADNDEGRLFTGEATVATDEVAPPSRRLSAVPSASDELPLGDDALELVHGQDTPAPLESPLAEESARAASEGTTDLTETVSAVRRAEPQPALDEIAADHADADWISRGTPVAHHPAAPAEELPLADESDSDDEAPRPDESEDVPPARKKGRSSVPSWDEIMFGGGKND
ncbi:MAG: hypothetical protein JWP74_3517 [Marmoricola sp.]|nr:hypothetical protein [Marmoricola sp.]